jgi:hypothetical protein
MKQTTPTSINIKVNGNKPQSQKTKNNAIRYRINQELKFLISLRKETATQRTAISKELYL